MLTISDVLRATAASNLQKLAATIAKIAVATTAPCILTV